MSGRKQHYIPQFFLKGFATARGKSAFVTVYPVARPVFEVPTNGVAAQREFYSELAVEGSEPTLDDNITILEGDLASVMKALRAAPAGPLLDAASAAGLVTHLTVRNAHFRSAATFGAEKMLETVTDVFTDRDLTRAALHLDAPTLAGPMRAEFDNIWKEYGALFEAAGISRAAFEELIRAQAGPIFEQLFGEIADGVEAATRTLEPQVATTGANAQKRALTQDLVPPLRVEKIIGFSWSIRPGYSGGLVLPDCVAIAGTKGQWLPLSLADLDEIEVIAMPLDASTLLWAERASPVDFPEDLNALCAACSWDFFLAPSRSTALEALIPLIRSGSERFFHDVMREALTEL